MGSPFCLITLLSYTAFLPDTVAYAQHPSQWYRSRPSTRRWARQSVTGTRNKQNLARCLHFKNSEYLCLVELTIFTELMFIHA